MGVYKCEPCRVHVCPLECVCVCARVWQRSVISHSSHFSSIGSETSSATLLPSAHHRLPTAPWHPTEHPPQLPHPVHSSLPSLPQEHGESPGQWFWSLKCREGFTGSCEVFKADFSKTKPWGLGRAWDPKKLRLTFSLPHLLFLQEW